jgi:hypothetical protein
MKFIRLKPKNSDYSVKDGDMVFSIPKGLFHEVMKDRSRLIWLLVTNEIWRNALFAIIKDWARIKDNES